MDSSNSAADRKLEQKANNERRAAALAKLNEDLALQKTKKLKVVGKLYLFVRSFVHLFIYSFIHPLFLLNES